MAYQSVKARALDGKSFEVFYNATWCNFAWRDGDHIAGPFLTARGAAKALLAERGQRIGWQEGYDLLDRCETFDFRVKVDALTA